MGLSVCLLSHISPLECLSEVKTFVGFSLKLLCCKDPAVPPLKLIQLAISAKSAHAHYSSYRLQRGHFWLSAAIGHASKQSLSQWHELLVPRVLHFSAFIFNPWLMRKRVTVLGFCVCVSVCLSVRAISAIPHNKTPKKGYHKNQRPMGKI